MGQTNKISQPNMLPIRAHYGVLKQLFLTTPQDSVDTILEELALDIYMHNNGPPLSGEME